MPGVEDAAVKVVDVGEETGSQVLELFMAAARKTAASEALSRTVVEMGSQVGVRSASSTGAG